MIVLTVNIIKTLRMIFYLIIYLRFHPRGCERLRSLQMNWNTENFSTTTWTMFLKTKNHLYLLQRYEQGALVAKQADQYQDKKELQTAESRKYSATEQSILHQTRLQSGHFGSRRERKSPYIEEHFQAFPIKRPIKSLLEAIWKAEVYLDVKHLWPPYKPCVTFIWHINHWRNYLDS